MWSVWPSEKSIFDPVVGNVTGTGNRSAGHTIGESARDLQITSTDPTVTPQTSNKTVTHSINTSQANSNFKKASQTTNISEVEASSDEYKNCPVCAETIKAKAIFCRFCKTTIDSTKNEIIVESEQISIKQNNSYDQNNSDEIFWEQAANELNSSERKEGLWAKCYVESEGNDSKCKVLYLKQRVEQLTSNIPTLKEHVDS